MFEKVCLVEELGDLKLEIIKINFVKVFDIVVMIGGEGNVNMLFE